MLFVRKIIPSPLSSICNIEPECSHHVIKDCKVAQEVWKLLPLVVGIADQDWCQQNLQVKATYQDIPLCVIFPNVCWELWTHRNKRIFENTPNLRPNMIIEKATQRAKFYWQSIESSSGSDRNLHNGS